MIRRGFWLTVGAAGGIMGYRRVSALSRQVSETLGGRSERSGASGRTVRPASRKRHWARETLRFSRDVREGMDMYIARQQGRPAPTLGPGARATTTDHDKREDH
jgi:hypothetical protein